MAYRPVSWIDDQSFYTTRFEHHGGLTNFIFSLDEGRGSLNDRHASLGVFANAGRLFLEDMRPEPRAGNVFFDLHSGTISPYYWDVPLAPSGKTFEPFVDYHLTSGRFVRSYRSPRSGGDGSFVYQLMLQNQTSGDTSVYPDRVDRQARFPRWIDDSRILYVSTQLAPVGLDELGESINVYFPNNGSQHQLIARSDIALASGVGFIDF